MRLNSSTDPVRWARRAMGVLVFAGLATMNVSTLAQESRQEELAAAQAAKAAALHPYVPSTAERRIAMLTRLTVPRPGWYPFIGGVFPGGSMAAGPGYRGRFGGSGSFDAHVARSVKTFTGADAFLALPDFSGGRVKAALSANWVNAPRVAFYGVGPASHEASETSFLYRATTLGAALRVKPARLLAVGGTFAYVDVHTGEGTEGSSIEEVFPPTAVPGLGASPAFVRTHVFAEVDSRSSPGWATSGGLYRIGWARYAARADDPYSFARIDAEIVQLISLLRDNWVIALRALQSSTQTSTGNAVPHFLMPELGGGDVLRGYPSWRFRDRNRTLLSAEYRWLASRFVEMALFTDAGAVTPRVRDLRTSDLRTSYGIGARLHTPAATMLRVDVARTSEGMGLVVAFGPSF